MGNPNLNLEKQINRRKKKCKKKVMRSKSSSIKKSLHQFELGIVKHILMQGF